MPLHCIRMLIEIEPSGRQALVKKASKHMNLLILRHCTKNEVFR